MSDNPKLKRLDAKRVALKQKHEIDYCRKIAKNFLQKTEKISGFNKLYATSLTEAIVPVIQLSSIKRLAKAFLKLLDKTKQHKK